MLAGSLALSGCSISRQVVNHDEPVRVDRTTEVVAGSRRYLPEPTLSGTRLNVHLTQAEVCETTSTPVIHRQQEIIKTAHPNPLAYILPGVGILGLGAAVAFGGEYVAPHFGIRPQPPLAYQITGGIIGAGGLALVLIGTVQGLRAVDRYRDLGEVALAPQSKREDCHIGPAVGTPVRLVLGPASELATKADSVGVARFSFSDVAADELPAEDARLAIKVGQAVIPLELEPRTIARLRQAVEKDPNSRAAKELFARRQAECTRLAGLAEATTVEPTTPEAVANDAIAAWQRAGQVCDELFTAEMQAKMAAVRTAMAQGAALRAHRLCLDKLQVVQAVSSARDASDALGQAEEACKETEIEPLRLLSAKKRVERLQAQEERAERAREAAERRREEAERAEERRQAAARRARQHSASRSVRDETRGLRCNDGTLSPSCLCAGPWRGCCSHHGGVAGCE